MTNPVGTNRKREWCVVVVVSRVTGSLSRLKDSTLQVHTYQTRECVSCLVLLCCAVLCLCAKWKAPQHGSRSRYFSLQNGHELLLLLLTKTSLRATSAATVAANSHTCPQFTLLDFGKCLFSSLFSFLFLFLKENVIAHVYNLDR